MISLRDWAEKVRVDHGRLTPRTLVEAARVDGPGACPVYDRFKFGDDETAADLWRLDEARNIIRTIKVTYRKSPKGAVRSVRAYHAVPDDSGGEPYRFEPVEDIAADPVLREIVLRDMKRDWLALKTKYGHMAEFLDLVAEDLATVAA